MYIYNGLHYTTIEMVTSICIDDRNEYVNLNFTQVAPSKIKETNTHTQIYLFCHQRELGIFIFDKFL